jgi:uncharacterized membrane protein YgdD (TMEM256/DUF423 family)
MSPALFRIAAALCFVAVALGAFGAHFLKATLAASGMLEVWNKAVLYHFLHAVALVAFALHGGGSRGAYYLLLAGIFFFSGSLYLMALTNVRWLGAITPIGGLCFLAGWAWLIIVPPRL